jgi:glycosyltransferase involved in cell wall biosynthesis
MPPPLAAAGSLDGLTILRYSHAYESGGGIEQYLHDLNRSLSLRNRLTTIQLQLTKQANKLSESTLYYGESKLITIPMLVRNVTQHQARLSNLSSRFLDRAKSLIRDHILFAPGLDRVLARYALHRHRIRRGLEEPDGAGHIFSQVLARHRIDLVLFHCGGGSDVSEILSLAGSAQIPVGMIHHFSNDRLTSLSLRQQLAHVRRVAGVCGTNVPAFLKSRFFNVSDGIDTDFYCRERARPLTSNSDNPILFLPARITPAKGQADVIRAAALLRQRGLLVRVVLAGRPDSPAFAQELQNQVRQYGLEKQVEFVGQLDPEQLRDWYAAAAVLVFPTYHHEGLPRILLESQSMETPPVVYDIGGTSEGICLPDTGILLRQGDVAGMISALEILLKDNSKRQRMGRAGRRFVESRFSLDALAARHEAYCQEVLTPESLPLCRRG